MKNGETEAAPLKLKLQVLEAERDRLAEDFLRIRNRLQELEREIEKVSRELDSKLRRRRIRRVK